MKYNTRQKMIIGLLVSLVAFSGWLFYATNQVRVQKNLANNPSAYMTNVHLTNLDNMGNVHTTLTAPKIINYEALDIMDAENPYITIHKPNQAPWHIRAKHGKSFNNMEKVILWDHVHVQQLPGIDSKNLTLLTSYMTVYPNQSYAITHEPVTIIQPGSTVHAVGMRANLDTGDITLLSKMSAQYHSD